MSPDDEKAQRRIELFKARLSVGVELQRATSAFEHAAIKPLYLLNGGAAVAMLALFGSIAAKVQDPAAVVERGWLIAAVAVWAVGLLMAALSTCAGLLSQLDFQREGTQRILATTTSDNGDLEASGRHDRNSTCYDDRGASRRRVAFALGVGSLMAFLIGIGLSCRAFTA